MKEIHTILLKDEELVKLNDIIEEQYKQRFYLTSIDYMIDFNHNKDKTNIFTFEPRR